MQNIFKQEKISEKLRIKLYKACVVPHLTYNIGTIPLKTPEAGSLNKAHRRGLRVAMNINHKEHVTNANLYKRAQTEPISITATERRWKLLGKILRGNEEDPALYCIRQYFDTENRKKIRGKYTTIATVLKEESKLAPLSAHSRAHNTSEKVELANGVSLRKYQELAKKPQEWKNWTKEITLAARKQWITADSDRMDRYMNKKTGNIE